MSIKGKQQLKELIELNIKQNQFHITVVQSEILPRYAYTIGLTNLSHFELIFAGGIYYMYDDIMQIFNEIVNELKKNNRKSINEVSVGSLGTFTLSAVQPSWSKLMLLGVFDYFKRNDINVYQIIPDQNHFTLDTPDMSKEFNPFEEQVWQWLVNKWDHKVPENSTVVTNINALQGETITELTRWETNEWEMIAGSGPDVEKKDMRVIPLAAILGIDETLFPALDLEIGKGLWRESLDAEWQSWG